MKKVKFQNTGLEVFPVCLGTVNYGSFMPEADSIRQLYEYVETHDIKKELDEYIFRNSDD